MSRGFFRVNESFLLLILSDAVDRVGRCQSKSRHGTRCCFLAQRYAQPYGDDLPCAQSDMPRKQMKRPEVTQGCNEALDLLRLQEYADKVTRTKAALEEIQAVLHEETILANFTSAQDRRTLNTAHCCLNSLRIRVEAHINSVEQTVKQRQLSLIQNQWEHCRPKIPNTPEEMRSASGKYRQFQTSNAGHPAHQPLSGSEPGQ